MAGKTSAGFTKSAQKQKFIRNRDIKMKGSEIRKEQKIQHLMCEGICKKCREVVQWRFRYDKYKSLKNPATCQQCKNKTINKAYRTLCDYCAGPKKLCASCCGDIHADISASSSELASLGASEGVTAAAMATADAAGATAGDVTMAEEGKELDAEESAMAAEDSDVETGDVVASASATADSTSEAEQTHASASLWDSRKFHTIAAQKYSKARVVGTEDDLVFSFAVTKAKDEAMKMDEVA